MTVAKFRSMKKNVTNKPVVEIGFVPGRVSLSKWYNSDPIEFYATSGFSQY